MVNGVGYCCCASFLSDEDSVLNIEYRGGQFFFSIFLTSGQAYCRQRKNVAALRIKPDIRIRNC